MRRREFVTLVGGAAAWPFATRAQPARPPTVGFLGAATLSAWSLWTAAFVQRLRELGSDYGAVTGHGERARRGPLSQD